MRLSVLLVALLTSACAMPSPIAPSNGPWKLSGTVVATDGARTGGPIVGATLTVVSSVNSHAKVTSDATGHYVFADLETGRYTVTIAAPGYVNATPVVDLYRDLDVSFALKPQ